MSKQTYLIVTVITLLITSCVSNSKSDDVIVNYIESPSTNPSSLPNLFSNKNKTLLTWIEKVENSKEKKLLYAELINGKWGVPKEITAGNDWAVNWADFPAIAENNGQILSHTLKLTSKENFVYDIKLNLLNKTNSEWTTDLALNTDGVQAEHGFVTMLPYKENSFFVTWLDGRYTGGSGHGSEGSSGAMSIRAAEVSSDGTIINEIELDNKACDCCQTTAAITNNGPVVIYRDRSDEEVRDISIVRMVDGNWTTPKSIYSDNWTINGCPVNGPSADVLDNNLAITWFSAVNGEPKVSLVFSKDGGENFDLPINISNTKPMGRVDVVMIDNENAVVSWMESDETSEFIKAIKVNRSGEKSDVMIISSDVSSQISGFPQMELVNDKLYFVWTNKINDKATTITAYVLTKNM